MVFALPFISIRITTSKSGSGVACTSSRSSFNAETDVFMAAGVILSSTWSIKPFTDSFFLELRQWMLKEPTVQMGSRSIRQSWEKQPL